MGLVMYAVCEKSVGLRRRLVLWPERPEVKMPVMTVEETKVRNSWKKGDKVEVHDIVRGRKKWCEATITRTFNDNGTASLICLIIRNDKGIKKRVPRMNKDMVREKNPPPPPKKKNPPKKKKKKKKKKK